MSLSDDVDKLRDKAEKLAVADAALTERLENALKEVSTAYKLLRETEGRLADLQRETEKELGLLRRESEEVKKWREELGRRAWSLAPSLVGAIIGGLIVLAVNYFFPRR